MGFLARLFAAFKPKPLDEAAQARIAAAIAEIKSRGRPSLRLGAGDGGLSWIGGSAVLSPGVTWPSHQGRRMDFLAQIDLEEVRAAGGPNWLPPQGRLLFFFDIEADGRPAHHDAVRVLHLDRAAQGPDAQSLGGKFRRRAVAFQREISMPSFERYDDVTDGLARRESDAVAEAILALEGSAQLHRIDGYPDPIQDDAMELACEIDALGVEPDDAASYGDPKVVAAAAAKWRLLLQLESDEDVGMMWWDGGALYFYVREDDARRGDFSQVRMVTQVH
jgi:uncharacterized protein YwqG